MALKTRNPLQLRAKRGILFLLKGLHQVILILVCWTREWPALLLLRYHIPRSWVHHGDNLLVLHEEIGGDPLNVSIVTKSGQEICAFISETDPPPPELWKPNLQLVPQSPHIRLSCEKGWRITSVSFASFGTPQGSCGTFSHGSCHVDMVDIVKKVNGRTRMKSP